MLNVECTAEASSSAAAQYYTQHVRLSSAFKSHQRRVDACCARRSRAAWKPISPLRPLRRDVVYFHYRFALLRRRGCPRNASAARQHRRFQKYTRLVAADSTDHLVRKSPCMGPGGVAPVAGLGDDTPKAEAVRKCRRR